MAIQDKIGLEIQSFKEKVEIAPTIEKMIVFHVRWFGYVWRRLVEALVTRVDLMEDSPIVRGRSMKTIGQAIIELR